MKPYSIILFSAITFLYSCSGNDRYEIKTADKYEMSKASLAETERKFPERFIKVTSTDKKNLLGQTVVKGTIVNTARVASFKDVDLKLSFYSKTGALLEEDHEVIYETVEPGGSKSFKSKYFTPKGTDSVAMNVISAKNE